MNYFFKALFLFPVLFLLKSCGETTPPEPFTPAQAELLLGGRQTKIWKKTTAFNKENNTPIACTEEEIWTFFPQKDSISFSSGDEGCGVHNEYSYAKYVIQNKNNNEFLKFYAYGVSEEDTVKKDTITRIITSITEKEFTTEINVGNSTIVELFQVQ